MRILGLTSEQWIDVGVSLFLLFATIVFGRWLVKVVLNQGVRRLTRKTSTTLDDALLEALIAPFHGLLIVIAFALAIANLDFIPASWAGPLNSLFFLLYLTIGYVIAWRVIVVVFKWYGEEIALKTETKLDEVLTPFLRRVALVVLSSIVVIMLLSYFEIDVSGLVATLGIGSLAIALAAQTALADIFSGIIIMIDQPFRLGDRIEIQELNTWGDVVDIGLRSTHIRTRDNRMVIVPNAIIGKSLIVNHAFPNSQYRIQVNIGVAYGSDVELARQTMIEAVRGVEGVLQDKPIEALFLEFGDSALVFRLRWWIESYVDTRRMFDKVNTAVYRALKEAGIEIPFPQQDVHFRIDPQEIEQIARALRSAAPPADSV